MLSPALMTLVLRRTTSSSVLSVSMLSVMQLGLQLWLTSCSEPNGRDLPGGNVPSTTSAKPNSVKPILTIWRDTAGATFSRLPVYSAISAPTGISRRAIYPRPMFSVVSSSRSSAAV